MLRSTVLTGCSLCFSTLIHQRTLLPTRQTGTFRSMKKIPRNNHSKSYQAGLSFRLLWREISAKDQNLWPNLSWFSISDWQRHLKFWIQWPYLLILSKTVTNSLSYANDALVQTLCVCPWASSALRIDSTSACQHGLTLRSHTQWLSGFFSSLRRQSGPSLRRMLSSSNSSLQINQRPTVDGIAIVLAHLTNYSSQVR